MNKNNQYKSIFPSDIHLGFNGCQHEKLESFLKSAECKDLYLVGDIIDFWSMDDNFYWPKEHQNILNIFNDMHEGGTNVFYISGNHDDPLRDQGSKEELKSKNSTYTEIMSILSKFNHRESYEFSSMKHGKMMVLHGDQYDVVTSNAKWISKLGGLIYDGLIFINRPLSKYLKNLTKKIVSGVSGFQNLVKKECQNGGYDGLICGHNHRPEILKFSTHVYLNTGDWVESCSAIVEEHNGTIKLINIEESNKINTMAEL
jgi:UDP-2,3-diacylglucosamine pyrophosphatase LpxH